MPLKTTSILILLILIANAVNAQKEYISKEIVKQNYRAYLLMQDSNYVEAIKFLDEAIAKDPEAFFVYQNRAICRLQLRDTIGAISDFKMNIKLEPKNAETRYALGNIYKKQNDSLNASYYFRQAIEKADADYSQTKLLFMNNFVGNVYRAHQEWSSAVVYYNQVKKYTPNDASVYINSALCYYHLDSTELFCNDMERAFVLGGSVSCILLKQHCNGCSHLIEERGGDVDTASLVLDVRLSGVIQDTIVYFYQDDAITNVFGPVFSKKEKVYFNKFWQICLPENAVYYRESFWAYPLNYFGGDYTDYYIDGSIYAQGRIESTKLEGDYISYYPNGEVRMKGRFSNGTPVGKWIWYNKNRKAEFQVAFLAEKFKIQFLDEESPNYVINTGSGKFSLTLDNWNGFLFELRGEYEDEKRTGTWEYIQDGQLIISEKYKKGEFKSGFIVTNNGNANRTTPSFNATIFIPPQLTQVRNLYFDSYEAADHYSFIRKN